LVHVRTPRAAALRVRWAPAVEAVAEVRLLAAFFLPAAFFRVDALWAAPGFLAGAFLGAAFFVTAALRLAALGLRAAAWFRVAPAARARDFLAWADRGLGVGLVDRVGWGTSSLPLAEHKIPHDPKE
jgi:hypothetical protein